ncbi:putative reverse transcriptase domain-containing protein [Tanacetum coccineum]
MNDMMNTRRHKDHNSQGSEGGESENPFFEGDSSSFDEQPDRPRRNQREDNRHWESRIRVNIPEFDGNTLNPEGFIDWLVAVEEVFEFKEVLENKRVSLIAIKLRGRASAWWQRLKLTRERVGKPKATSWRTIFKRPDDQLVSRYIGGLRAQIMDSVTMFDSVTLSDAYQRALAFEKQNRRVGSSSSPAITRGGSGSSNMASHFVPNQARPSGGSGLKCFNCGKPGYRQSECKKAGKRTLFAEHEEWEDDGVANDGYEGAQVFDDDQYEEKVITEDVGVNLMVRRSCLTPQVVGDDWLKHDIFQSTCTILGKVCMFMVDPGSCDNLIAEEAVQKLGLKAENRPKPYKLQWLKKGSEVEGKLEVGDEVHEVVCDFVWAVLTKDRFPVGEYNKLSAKKIDLLEIVEKINSNAYRLKLPSHIRCSDVFNVKHLFPYHGDSSDDDLVMNSRADFVYPEGNDVGPSVEERALLFLEARDRAKKRPCKAYVVLNKDTMKVKESLNVTFDESPPPAKLSPLVDDDIGEEEAIKRNTKLVNNNNEED